MLVGFNVYLPLRVIENVGCHRSKSNIVFQVRNENYFMKEISPSLNCCQNTGECEKDSNDYFVNRRSPAHTLSSVQGK